VIGTTPDLPTRLKAARRAAGFKTARAAVNAMQIPLNTYNQHETGRRVPSDEALLRYSKCFRVNLEWLKTGTGIPLKPQRTKEQEKILKGELLDLHQISKASTAFIDEELLREILEKLLTATEKKKITAKAIATAAVEMYADIVSVESSPELQRKMVEPVFSAWKRYKIK
jgi:transcriptional regulator with XRE-family HTH domain